MFEIGLVSEQYSGYLGPELEHSLQHVGGLLEGRSAGDVVDDDAGVGPIDRLFGKHLHVAAANVHDLHIEGRIVNRQGLAVKEVCNKKRIA